MSQIKSIKVSKFNNSEISFETADSEFLPSNYQIAIDESKEESDERYMHLFNSMVILGSSGKSELINEIKSGNVEIEWFGNKKSEIMFGVKNIREALKTGSVLIIDDLNWHFDCLCELVEIFNDNSLNKNHAQLLFTTNVCPVMKKFRSDQIWFVDTKKDGSKEVFSLIEFNDVSIYDPHYYSWFLAHRFTNRTDVSKIKKLSEF